MRHSGVTLLLLLTPQLALADKGVFHRVTNAGETYADIADHYYGHRYLERHLRMFNRRPEPLREGTTIIIPTYELVPLKRNQTMPDFAAEHLSDPDRAEYLAELHNLKGRDRKLPRPGKRFRVVQSLKHIALRGETLESIANLYYRDVGPRRLLLLMLYNHMPNEAVKIGAAIRIPLDTPEFNKSTVALRAREPFSIKKAVAEAPPPRPPPPATAPLKRERPKPARVPVKVDPDKLAEHVEQTERLYGDGEYQACVDLAARALTEADGAKSQDRIALLQLLAFSQIALGDYPASKLTFKKLLAIDPKAQLDLYQTSPKILDIFEAVALR